MSTHHGHHRSHHSRSRIYHSSHHHSNHNRSRTSSSNNSLNNNHNSVSNRISHQSQASPLKESNSEWQQHRSSSGKVYYYNNKTGLSQWEVPAELRQQQQQQQQPQHHNHHLSQQQQHQHHQHHQHQQQQQHHQLHVQQQHQQHQPTAASPESEISESSSIRQQQDKSPSSSASSHASARSNSIPEDKPLLTPSLAQYFRPELISNLNSSRLEEPERLANQYSREALELSERILSVSVDLKIARSMVQFVEISLEAQEKKYSILRNTMDKYFPQ